MSGQARDMAHLRPLPRCRCGAAATEALYTGLNDLVSYHCSGHARAALKTFKEAK